MLSLESVLMITDINKLKKQLRIIFNSLDDDYSQYSNDYRVSSYETYRIDEILHTREGKEFIKEVSDFIVKTNYLNMIYDSNYFAYRLLT